MTPLHRLVLGLRALAILFAGIAFVLLVWRPRVPLEAAPVAGLDAATAALPATATPDVSPIVNANLFSAARRAPAVRYRPFATEAEPAPPRRPVAAGDAGRASGVPQFFGTVTGPRGTFALLRLDASTPDAQLYREGDAAFGYRVVSINEQSVVLSGPRGRIELRLTRPGGPMP